MRKPKVHSCVHQKNKEDPHKEPVFTQNRPISGLAAIMDSGPMDFDLGAFNRCLT